MASSTSSAGRVLCSIDSTELDFIEVSRVLVVMGPLSKGSNR